MLDFFSSLISYIETIWVFFLNMIETLLTFVQTLAGVTILPPLLVRNMWAPIATCVLSVVGFSVIKLLIGRSNI